MTFSQSSMQKLRHNLLEQAIYGKKSISALVPHGQSALGMYLIADYVGSHTAKTDGYAKHDLRKTVASVFFEDDGGYKKTYVFEQKDFNLAVFATFVVIEIRPNTESVEFLVLIPPRDESLQEARYAGLMKSQNNDQLLNLLDDSVDALAKVETHIEDLLTALRSDAVMPQSNHTAQKKLGNWFSRLFG